MFADRLPYGDAQQSSRRGAALDARRPQGTRQAPASVATALGFARPQAANALDSGVRGGGGIAGSGAGMRPQGPLDEPLQDRVGRGWGRSDDYGRRKATDSGTGGMRTGEAVWRPHPRQLKPHRTGTDYERMQCKRYVSEPVVEDTRYMERRHMTEATERSGFDIPDPDLNIQAKGRCVDDKGRKLYSGYSYHGERSLETEMGKKIAIPTKRQMRNGIPQVHPGDKHFRAAEYEVGFFTQEGHVIPGSCIGQNRGKRRGQPVIGGFAPRPDDGGVNYRKPVPFSTKRFARGLIDDMEEVRCLTASASNARGETLNGWEQRTTEATGFDVGTASDDED